MRLVQGDWVTVNVKRSVVILFPLRAPQAQKPPTDSGLYDTKDLGAFVPGTCKSIQTVRVIPYALSERESCSRYNATVTAKVFEETVALYAARERQQRCNLGRISERPVFELRGHVVIVFNAVIVVKCCAVGAGQARKVFCCGGCVRAADVWGSVRGVIA
uniref:Uncharacterized protein n=1 Tax=Anopheles melas TaxID=34690 RepID=A0A182TRL0_9DIPT